MMLVEALSRNPAFSARLVGPVTQPDYLDELLRRAAELGVSNRLEVVGALKPGSPELVAEYLKADAFVLTSRHEPFGIVVLEAWAAGLPVVASDVGGLGRLCAAHPGAALTIPVGDGAALDAALARLVGDASLRESMSSAGREAAKRYDWRSLAATLDAFYSTLRTR
jgi:glycosyltransferase involved in cell wall biosynthesis